jgi:hypothetical protein
LIFSMTRLSFEVGSQNRLWRVIAASFNPPKPARQSVL